MDFPIFDAMKAKFPTWKQTVLCLAKLYGLFQIFAAGVDVPISDKAVSNPTLQQDSPGEDFKTYSIAWNIFSRALEGNSYRDTLRHVTSPAAG